MMRYAALLRGLNVGGKGRVPMPALKALLSGLGLRDVQTLLQSGNAVFESDLDMETLTARIRAAFLAQFGFDGFPAVRDAEALRRLKQGLPFSEAERAEAHAADPEAEHLYVYFTDTQPEPEQIRAIMGDAPTGDRLVAGERALYLLCRQSIRLSKTAIRLGKALPTATARNWNTVCKLESMVNGG